MDALTDALNRVNTASARLNRTGRNINFCGLNLTVHYHFNPAWEGDYHTAPVGEHYDILKVELGGFDVTDLVKDRFDEIEQILNQ